MKITIVQGEDWIGLYLDGKLRYENHSITPYDLLDIIGIGHTWIQADNGWLHDEVDGQLPENLSDVKPR